jgi:hypothetical protein
MSSPILSKQAADGSWPKLIELRGQYCIDPAAIVALEVTAAYKPQFVSGIQCKAMLRIETLRGDKRVPCDDARQAEQLKNTLLAIANKRTAKPIQVKHDIDWKGRAMPGDAGYQDSNHA